MATLDFQPSASSQERPIIGKADPIFTRRTQKVLKGGIGIGLFFLAWQIGSSLSSAGSYFFPKPIDVFNAFVELTRKGILEAYLIDSLGRYMAGVALGLAVGLIAALLLGLNKYIARIFTPIVSFFYAIVESAWLPIFVIWFGYGITTILTLLVYVVAFPILYNTLAGIRAFPPTYINAAKTLGGSRLQIITNVILPGLLPNIITGFRVGAGFAFRGLIIAEAIAATSGIGFLIFDGAANQQTERTIVGMIVMGTLWLLIELFYLQPFEKATVQRWGLIISAEGREGTGG